MEQKPKLIGVCLSTIHNEDRLSFVKALNDYAVSGGYRLIIFNSCLDLFEQKESKSESSNSVFRLIPYSKLSALIIFPNFICSGDMIEYIVAKCRAKDVPVISIDKKLEGCIRFSFAYGDSFENICNHVIKVHKAREIYFIAGYPGNEYSDQRENAFRRALEANGLKFNKKNVGYGCFWENPTIDVLNSWFDIEHRPLPDAIICANDVMAITVSNYLQERGIRIPDDCIVTGFDGIEQARFHLPHITTSRQNYSEMGRRIIETVTALRRGETVAEDNTIGFNTIFSQSCGCQEVNDSNINFAIQTLIERMKASNERQRMMCSLQTTIANTTDINLLPSRLTDGFNSHTAIFALNDDIFEAPDYGSTHKNENAFTRNISIIHQCYSWCEEEQCTIRRSELVPDLGRLTADPEPIIVCAACFVDTILGYCVFQPVIDTDEYQKIHTFMSAIGAAVGNFHSRILVRDINRQLVRANENLHMLSQRDFMTGLFNRRGFFDGFDALINENSDKDSTAIVISADLDELKHINDTYGHHEGDNAINTVSRALVSSSVHGEICARFGGDEFCVAAVISTQEAAYYFSDFKERFQDFLFDYNRKSEKPYKVRASIGCCIDRINNSSELDAMIKVADEHMYADKISHKRQRKR